MGGDKFRDEYSLAFDGTDDYIATGAKPVDTADATYVFWAKSDATGQNFGVFGHGANNKGAFDFNHTSGEDDKPLLYLADGHFQYWDNTPAQDDGQWHHWAVVVDIDSMADSKLYVDGVLQNQSSRAQGTALAYGNLEIARSNTTYEYEGSMSEFAVYNVMLSASQVKTLYNGREPYNHKEGIASGNLKAWYRMGDGKLDALKNEYSVIAEGGFLSDESQSSHLGTDLVDDVMNASNWDNFSTGTNGIDLESGAIKITYTDNADGAYFHLRDSKGLTTDLTVGKVYKVSYQAKVNSGSSVTTQIAETGEESYAGNTITGTTYSNFAIYIVCTATQDHHFWVGSMATGEIAYVQNVKVQEVVGNTGVLVNMNNTPFSGDTP